MTVLQLKVFVPTMQREEINAIFHQRPYDSVTLALIVSDISWSLESGHRLDLPSVEDLQIENTLAHGLLDGKGQTEWHEEECPDPPPAVFWTTASFRPPAKVAAAADRIAEYCAARDPRAEFIVENMLGEVLPEDREREDGTPLSDIELREKVIQDWRHFADFCRLLAANGAEKMCVLSIRTSYIF